MGVVFFFLEDGGEETRPTEVRANCLGPHNKFLKEPEIEVKGTWFITAAIHSAEVPRSPPISEHSSYSLMGG